MVPEHVAIIPDGNRRWAKKKAFSILKGHETGTDVLMEVLRAAKKIGIKTLTFYGFSTENWFRPKTEVKGLMWLIESYLEKQLSTMLEEGVQFHTIGQIEGLPESLQNQIARSKRATAHCQEIHLVLALNYGGKDEIVRACRKIASEVASSQIKVEEIDETLLSKRLDTHLWKDPDLLIRTSGECRLSNFLLWQMAYGEIYLSPVLWPDFTPEHLQDAVKSYQMRERRRGE